MSRSIIFSLTALFAFSILVLLSGNAQAGWTENFESYTAGSVLPSPWDEGDSGALGANVVTAGAGYLGGQGMVFGDNPPGNAWRLAPNSGVTQLTARLYSDSSESYPSRYYVGFHTDPTVGGDTFPNNDGVYLYLAHHPEGGFISFENPNYDNQDPRQFVSQGTAFSGQNVGIAGDTWYDVRITLNGDDTATAEYKEASSPTWLTVGATGIAAIGDPVNFAPNYVSIRGERGARIDDITVNGVIPEPSSMALILVGLAAHGWRRRQTLRR